MHLLLIFHLFCIKKKISNVKCFQLKTFLFLAFGGVLENALKIIFGVCFVVKLKTFL